MASKERILLLFLLLTQVVLHLNAIELGDRIHGLGKEADSGLRLL